jgi:hypothetical protein
VCCTYILCALDLLVYSVWLATQCPTGMHDALYRGPPGELGGKCWPGSGVPLLCFACQYGISRDMIECDGYLCFV